MKKNCPDIPRQAAFRAKGQEFAFDLRPVVRSIPFHFDAQCRDKAGSGAHPNQRGSPDARVLIEDALTCDAEKGLRGGVHAV